MAGHSCPQCGWPKKTLDPEAVYRAARAASQGDDPGASARAARKTARRTAAGLCVGCGERAPAPLCIRCFECLEARRTRRRKRAGLKP